ncbi:MAG: flavodoxin domain-containing protein [Syntrophomonadaceae bacterium]
MQSQREEAANSRYYDQIIIGRSIYIGKIQKEVSRFCTDHMALRG